MDDVITRNTEMRRLTALRFFCNKDDHYYFYFFLTGEFCPVELVRCGPSVKIQDTSVGLSRVMADPA